MATTVEGQLLSRGSTLQGHSSFTATGISWMVSDHLSGWLRPQLAHIHQIHDSHIHPYSFYSSYSTVYTLPYIMYIYIYIAWVETISSVIFLVGRNRWSDVLHLPRSGCCGWRILPSLGRRAAGGRGSAAVQRGMGSSPSNPKQLGIHCGDAIKRQHGYPWFSIWHLWYLGLYENGELQIVIPMGKIINDRVMKHIW